MAPRTLPGFMPPLGPVSYVAACWPARSPVCPLQESNKRLEQTTVKLQEEKLRLDALLVRQYNLIAMLGKPRGGRGGAAGGSHGDTNGGGTGGTCEGGSTGSVDSSLSKGLTLGGCDC